MKAYSTSYPILQEARRSAAEQPALHEVPQSVAESAVSTVCALCKVAIDSQAEVLVYSRGKAEGSTVVHRECGESDAAARLRIAVAYGVRGLRALR